MKYYLLTIIFLLTGTAFAQTDEDVYIAIYKSQNENEARIITKKTTIASKLIKITEGNEWVVGLGPYNSVSNASNVAIELDKNSRKNNGQPFIYALLRFKKNTNDSNLTSENLITNISANTPTQSTRVIPPIRLSTVYGNGTNYYIPLKYYNLEVGGGAKRNAGYCNISVFSDGKLLNKYSISEPYELDIKINDDYMDEIRLYWDKEITALARFSHTDYCYSKGDIYLSEIYASGWRQLEEKFNQQKIGGAACLKFGMEFKGIPYYTTRQEDVKKYPSTVHPIAIEVLNTCTEIINQELKINYECEVDNSSRKTKCSDSWAEMTGNKYYKFDGYKSVVEAKLRGKKITVIGFETTQAEREYKAIIAAKEAKRISDEEERRKWLATPEGKKYLDKESEKIKQAEVEKRIEDAYKKKYDCIATVDNIQRPNTRDAYKSSSEISMNIEINEKRKYIRFSTFGFGIGQTITSANDVVWGISEVNFSKDYVEGSCKNCLGLGSYKIRLYLNQKKFAAYYVGRSISSDVQGSCRVTN